MFKFIIALSLLIVIQGQIPGGFMDRPDLLHDPLTTSMVRLAVSELATKQNLFVTPDDVIAVASQVVNGINYMVVFKAHTPSSDRALFCTTKVYQTFTGEQSITSVNCA
jgi:hypothetical protein